MAFSEKTIESPTISFRTSTRAGLEFKKSENSLLVPMSIFFLTFNYNFVE